MSEEKVTVTLPAHVFPMVHRFSLESLTFWFWSVAAAKPFLGYLFFQGQAVLGTVAGGGLSLFFLLLVVPHVLTHGLSRTAFVWPAATKWLMAYVFWVVCTLIWTHAESLPVAIAYTGVLVSDVILIGLLMRLENPSKVAMAAMRGLVMGTATLAVVTLGFGGTTVDSRLGHAEFLHPNVIGKQMAIASLCAIWLFLRARGRIFSHLFWAGCCALLMVTLLFSLSKTAIVAFAVGFFFLVFASGTGWREKFFVVALFLMTILLAIDRVTDYLEEYLYVTQGGHALLSVSGRGLIWEQTWEMICANPQLGYGIMAFRDVGPQISSERLVTAHNEWLHQWFSYGLVGLLLCALIYVSFLWLLLRTRQDQTAGFERSLGFGLLAFSLIRGLFEAEMTGLIFPLPLFLLITLWLANLNLSGRTA